MEVTALRNQVLTKTLMILVMIFLANELNTSMTMAQCQVFHVRKIPEEVFEQSHVSHQNKYTQQTQT